MQFSPYFISHDYPCRLMSLCLIHLAILYFDIAVHVCSAVAEVDRQLCPFSDERECTARGCCWDDNVRIGIPHCYTNESMYETWTF